MNTNEDFREESASAENTAGIPAGLSALLSDPQLLTKLAPLISTLSGSMRSEAPNRDESDESVPTGSMPSIDPSVLAKLAPLLGGIGGLGGKPPPPPQSGCCSPPAPPQKKPPKDPRCDLLRALKPYLSEQRCEAVDYILKISQLGEILRGFERK